MEIESIYGLKIERIKEIIDTFEYAGYDIRIKEEWEKAKNIIYPKQ